MKILKLTAEHFKKNPNEYWSDYIGTEDVSDYDGSIEITADLGCVRFSGNLKAKGFIRALSGSGISAGSGIEAGWGI
jgi:hypothetical protein